MLIAHEQYIADGVNRRKPDRSQHRFHDIPHTYGLNNLIGNAPGKITLEIPQRLVWRVMEKLAADHIANIGRINQVIDHMDSADQKLARNHQRNPAQQKSLCILLFFNQFPHIPENDRGWSGNHNFDHQNCQQQPFHLTHKKPDKRHQIRWQGFNHPARNLVNFDIKPVINVV